MGCCCWRAEDASGTRYQFERVGYFCVDPYSRPRALVFNRTIALRDGWARVERALALLGVLGQTRVAPTPHHVPPEVLEAVLAQSASLIGPRCDPLAQPLFCIAEQGRSLPDREPVAFHHGVTVTKLERIG